RGDVREGRTRWKGEKKNGEERRARPQAAAGLKTTVAKTSVLHGISPGSRQGGGVNKRGANRKPWRVQLVVEPDQEYFREVVLGARRYAFESGGIEFVDRWLPHELAGDPRKL